MMVPRAYQYRSSVPSVGLGINEKDGVAVAAKEDSPKALKRKDKSASNGRPAWLSSPPVATPSKPVVIPTRTRDSGSKRKKEAPAKGKRASERDDRHDPTSVPSSVAALVAMTTIPEPKGSLRSVPRRGVRYAPKIKRKEETDGARNTASISTSSPRSWDMLLSPPNELDSEYSSFGSNTTLDAGSFVRTLSIDSMPSLDDDCDSSPSPSNSIPSTPGLSIRSRSGYERRTKELSTSRTEDCALDHPLLPLASIEEPSSDTDAELPVTGRRTLSRSTSALKSNLSASIALIRSAARSFTYFTAPAISRDEYLTRSLLAINPPFTDERRPPPTLDLPDPALRRYLNPTTISPSELHIHHDHPQSSFSRDRCTASIQLQSYKRGTRPSDNASAPPIFASKEKADAAIAAAAEEPFSTPGPKQREMRENSDFLRVIVLEMNMRRSGQLGDGVPGRARMALPARQASRKEEEDVAISNITTEKGVPRRWVAVSAS